MGRCGLAVAFVAACARVAAAQSVEYVALPADFYPTGVSGDGQVVVGYSTRGGTYGLRRTRAGGLQELRAPNGDRLSAKAWATNFDGTAIAGTTHFNNAQVPFRWTPDTGIVPILGIGGGGFSPTNGYGISGDGSVDFFDVEYFLDNF